MIFGASPLSSMTTFVLLCSVSDDYINAVQFLCDVYVFMKRNKISTNLRRCSIFPVHFFNSIQERPQEVLVNQEMSELEVLAE